MLTDEQMNRTVTVHDVHAVYTASQTPCVDAPCEAVPHAASSQQPRAEELQDHTSNKCSTQPSSL